MPNIPITQILDRLHDHVNEEEAEILLAAVLDHLKIPVRTHYTPDEVIAIGAEIADLHRAQLAHLGRPEAQALKKAVDVIVEAIQSDAPHQPKNPAS